MIIGGVEELSQGETGGSLLALKRSFLIGSGAGGDGAGCYAVAPTRLG